MFCAHCQTILLEGQKCTHCGRDIPIFQPPPGEWEKKSELHQKTRELQSGELDRAGFLAYVREERGKIERARAAAGNHPDQAPLLEGVRLWEQALDTAEQWSENSSELLLQACLALATQTDAQLKRAVQIDWEKTRDTLASQQWQLRLKGYEPPPPIQAT